MCSPVRCRRCGKTTWSGCGLHVDQIMRSVPKRERCSCRSDARREAPAAPTSAFGALFGSGGRLG
ncbi:MAG: hypothetical protein KDC46_12895 [Thermoleophilia bacterium]|nr:hypothetical protein [Thermoleophilia bacterium]